MKGYITFMDRDGGTSGMLERALSLYRGLRRRSALVRFIHGILKGVLRGYDKLVKRGAGGDEAGPTPEDSCLPGEWIRYARAQTRFFYNLAMENLPEWLVADIDENALSILDFGCSMGDGVDILARRFRRSRVVGIDIDKQKIDLANQFYPEGTLVCADIRDMTEKFDCIFSSNTLEHFERPFDEVKELFTGHANKYMMLLVPFQEYERVEGHCFTFDHGNIPSVIENFRLVYIKEMDCRKHPRNHYYGGEVHWYGKQAILLYINESEKQDVGRMS